MKRLVCVVVLAAAMAACVGEPGLDETAAQFEIEGTSYVQPGSQTTWPQGIRAAAPSVSVLQCPDPNNCTPPSARACPDPNNCTPPKSDYVAVGYPPPKEPPLPGAK